MGLTGATDRKCIISHAVGTDHIDLAYCREANIQVMTCTGCNTESVAEHAVSLYFATRRSLVSVHNTLADFEPGRPNEWKSKGQCVTRNRAPLPLFLDGFKGIRGRFGGRKQGYSSQIYCLPSVLAEMARSIR